MAHLEDTDTYTGVYVIYFALANQQKVAVLHSRMMRVSLITVPVAFVCLAPQVWWCGAIPVHSRT